MYTELFYILDQQLEVRGELHWPAFGSIFLP